MPLCRYCGVEIFFAWHPSWLRWVPIEPESITGDEAISDDERGVVYESYHRRHRCVKDYERWAENARRQFDQKAREQHQRARESNSRTPFVAVRSESWAHATLFVAVDAPIEVIRAAYKALAMLYHPDHGGDSERMVELNRAYETLLGKN